MQAEAAESGSENESLFTRVDELEGEVARARRDAEAAEREAAETERAVDSVRPVRPHANSLLAYFTEPRSLPPVPAVPVEPDVAAIRTEHASRSGAVAGPAYRSEAESARARLAALQPELDAAHTRVARARQRVRRAASELARRQARARLDHRFSAKETLQVVGLLAAVLGAGIVLALAGLALGMH